MTHTSPLSLPETRENPPTPNKQSRAEVHAKAILFGEHSVVYGSTAIALPIHALKASATARPGKKTIHLESELYSGDAAAAPPRLGPIVTAIRQALNHIGQPNTGLHITIKSAIPHERGLGSSAAVAAAIIKAVAKLNHTPLHPHELYKLVQASERVAHFNPSGLDTKATQAKTPIRFEKGICTPITPNRELHFILADTGIPGLTAKAVANVRKKHENQHKTTNNTLKKLGKIAQTGAAALQTGNTRQIGEAMNNAHEQLQQLEISTPQLDQLRKHALQAGALGAKLTGGGLGGCIIALAADKNQAHTIRKQLENAGAKTSWPVTIPAQ